MSDDALTMRGPVHRTKDPRKVATPALEPSPRLTTSSGSAPRPPCTSGTRSSRAPARSPAPWPHSPRSGCGGTWTRSSTTRGSSRSTTSSTSVTDFRAAATPVGDLHPTGGRCPSPPYPAPSGRPAGTRRPATRRRRSTDPPPFPQRTTWTSLHDAKTNSTALDRISLSGAIPKPAGAAMTTRSRRRAAPPGPRHTDTAAPPWAATASPRTITSEYLVDNRSVPS